MDRRLYAVPVIFLLALNVFVWREVFSLQSSQYLQVAFLDVAQGDAIFIKTPAMHQILIDGGPNANVLGKLQALMPFWDRSLDVVMLTHPDADHLTGLLYVLQKYKVKYVVWTGVARDGQMHQRWIELLQKAQERGTKIITAKMGRQIESGKAVITILNPVEDLNGTFFKSTTNESGIVSRLDFGNNSFLFTADIGAKTEKLLIGLAQKSGKGVDLKTDVLKVGHHGSKYSSSEYFIQAVSPSVAAISVGAKNTYGHPTPEVLQRLKNFGIRVLRTDQQGDLVITSDGESINIKTKK